MPLDSFAYTSGTMMSAMTSPGAAATGCVPIRIVGRRATAAAGSRLRPRSQRPAVAFISLVVRAACWGRQWALSAAREAIDPTRAQKASFTVTNESDKGQFRIRILVGGRGHYLNLQGEPNDRVLDLLRACDGRTPSPGRGARPRVARQIPLPYCA